MVWTAFRRDAETARALCEDPDGVEELLEADDATSVDVDKAWHAIHWLLTGSDDATPAVVSAAILGGEPVGDDVGYGPARILSPSDVGAVAAALRELDAPTLRGRMDGPAMTEAGIYPMIWDEDDVFDEYLAPSYERLRTFYLAAEDAGEAVIQVLC
jgi:hypothetical protein